MVLQRTSWQRTHGRCWGYHKESGLPRRNVLCLIKSAEEFSNQTNKVVNGITSLYLPEPDLLAEPDNIEEAPKIPETLSVHMLVRNFNEDSVCSINFFNLAADVEPFFTQFYIKDGDPEVCGHEMVPLSFDPDQTCAFCKG